MPRLAGGGAAPGDSDSGSFLHSSLVLLMLRAERAELKHDHSLSHILSRNRNLEKGMTELQRAFQEEKEKATQRCIEHQRRVVTFQ